MEHRFITKRFWKDTSTAMSKSYAMARQFDDVINLSLGDPDLITDANISYAAYQDSLAGHTKYTDFRGDPELRKAILDYYHEELHIPIKDEEICVSCACLAMNLALQAILDDGDEVIIHAPYYTQYPQQIELARGVPVILNTYEEEDFQINIERLESLITDKTKALVINTPNNPTGTCFTEETMRNIAAVAIKHDLVVISDEIYTLYSFENPFMSMLSVDGMRERTIVINSFSKDYTMTGWRIGHIIAPDFIIDVIRQISEKLIFTAPTISQRAALYAMTHRDEIQPAMREEYKSRVFYAAERINNIPNMSVMSPRGTFYLFFNIKKTGLSSQEVQMKILQEAHVLTLPGSAFGDCGEGYIRIACTVGVDKLKEAFDRIEKMDIFK